MMLLLTEAGEGIGFGHLTRMLALGDALIDIGVDVQLVVQWEGDPVPQVVERRAWVSSESWRDDLTDQLLRHDAAAAVVDSYRLPLTGFNSIARSGTRLIVVDDFYRLAFPADLVINPNIYGDARRYLGSARDAIGGAKGILLRRAVSRAAGAYVVRPGLDRILVSLGGTDGHGVGMQLSKGLAAEGYLVEWLGPGQDSINLPGVVCRETIGAEDFVELVKSVDLVVCGGGQTLHELACLGAPCVGLELGDDQQMNLAFYERAGWLNEHIHWSRVDLADEVLRRIGSLRSEGERRRISFLGRGLVDGSGAEYIAMMIKRIAY